LGGAEVRVVINRDFFRLGPGPIRRTTWSGWKKTGTGDLSGIAGWAAFHGIKLSDVVDGPAHRKKRIEYRIEVANLSPRCVKKIAEKLDISRQAVYYRLKVGRCPADKVEKFREVLG
jgi:hypothetical protein